jgi:hypothetical protein
MQGRGTRQRFAMLVLLKAFQNLGHFPPLHHIPQQIINYIQAQVPFTIGTKRKPIPDVSLYRYHEEIRTYLKVRPYQEEGRLVVERAIERVAPAMDDPADLINVAIEELIRQRFELPAFSTLDRLVNHLRTQYNEMLFTSVMMHLSQEDKQILDSLTKLSPQSSQSIFVILKEKPGAANLTELQNMEARLQWLKSLIDIRPINDLPQIKIRHFAAEARGLETHALREISASKRYTLLLCLIYHAQVQARDHLVEIFLKRMTYLHKRAQETLSKIREQQRTLSERVIDLFAQIVQQTENTPEDTVLGREVRLLLQTECGLENLRQDCEALLAYRDNNHLPLIYRFYSSYRRTLFRLIRTLDIRSTTVDTALLNALYFVEINEDNRADLLPATLDLEFANEKWQQVILNQDQEGAFWLHRRQLIDTPLFLATA